MATMVSCLSLPTHFHGPPVRIQQASSSVSRLSPVLPNLPHVICLQQHFMLRCSSGESVGGRESIGSMAMCRRAGIVALLSCALLFPCMVMAAKEDQPKDFDYYQIWVSQDGETHFAKCKMKGFNFTAYASLPQYVRSDFGGEPVGVVLTELPVGMMQPLHSPPTVQFVTTLSGSWYIETTDGTRHNFKKGQLLFQDNTRNSPADKQPMHYSGTHGDKPCHQLIVQLSRSPQVDNPCPF